MIRNSYYKLIIINIIETLLFFLKEIIYMKLYSPVIYGDYNIRKKIK